MRKSTYLIIVFLSITAILFAKKPWPTTVAGTYKIAAFDKVPTAEFDSLAEAVAWLNSTGPVTGDIVFEIGSDLIEWTDFGLAKDMAGYKLTIRPDMDADRKILFPIEASKVNNAFLYGNFFIGYRTGAIKNQSNSTIVPDSLISTSNVTIDGFAVGGSTRRLKWAVANRPAPQSAIFSINGSCSNITIKNCLFDLQNTFTGASYGVYIYQVKSTTFSIDRSPSNILIDNNQFTTAGGEANGCIGFGKLSSPQSQISAFVISNNKFKFSGSAIILNSTYNIMLDILNNEFSLTQGTTAYTVANKTIGISTSTNCPGTINIIGNKFLETSTKQLSASTMATIYISGTGSTISAPDVNIYNNTFAGLNRFGASASTVNVHMSYILAGSGNEHTKIYNNTFYLPGLAMPNTSGDFMAIRYESATASAWKANIKNNIFATDDDKKAIFISNINTSSLVDRNAYCFYPTTYKSGITRNIVGAVTDTIRTLAALKKITTLYDNNSVETPVAFTNVLTGDLTLDAGLMALEYCLPLSAPKLAEVMTDLTGKVRGNPTLMGAHEVLTLPTDISKTNSSVKLIRTLNGIEIRTDKVAKIQIIDMNGILIDQAVIESRYFRNLQNGVYVVLVNGETFKFVK